MLLAPNLDRQVGAAACQVGAGSVESECPYSGVVGGVQALVDYPVVAVEGVEFDRVVITGANQNLKNVPGRGWRY